MSFPCGKCIHCVSRRISSWSARLMQEDRVSRSSFFVTLTYDTDHVPLSDAGYMTLSSRDLQLFFKRFRKLNLKLTNDKLKYYACGEYGSRRMRPHYHIILFNASLVALIGDREASFVSRKIVDLDGYHNYRCAAWPAGSITVGRVNEASVGYCLKYLSKQGKIPVHRKDDRIPEFQRTSKGLGVSYLDSMALWHEADILNRFYMPLKGGMKVCLPRYYKQKLYTESDRLMIGEHLSTLIAASSLESSVYPLLSNYRYRRLSSVL